jgi:filamentous hemagglutinin
MVDTPSIRIAAGADDIIKSLRDDVSKLAGKLSSIDARKWYLSQESRIRGLINPRFTLEKQAKQAFDLRNLFRTMARDLIADRDLAEKLLLEDPNLTWDQVIQKAVDKGYTGDEIYRYIIDSSQRSRPSVNKDLGLSDR